MLYESPAGLYFFDPPIAGDGDFYRRFYTRIGGHELINKRLPLRVEYRHAAKLVPEGASVLDVGCGMAGFGTHLPHAQYRGLDPYAPAEAPAQVVRETLATHALRNSGTYDVVSAFQVIEHVPDPLGFARDLVGLLRPGGLLILCGPLHPSRLTEIPNFVLNLPPHHLTWWNTKALATLAAVLRLEVVEIVELPPSPHAAIVDWMHLLSLARTQPPPTECYFDHRWSWHLNLAVSYGLARLADRWLSPPKSSRPYDVFLAARKGAVRGGETPCADQRQHAWD
jgi:SAM-dependent methyltransferase